MIEALTKDQQDLIEHLMSDKQAFDAFVYTPWREAVHELHARQNIQAIRTFQENILSAGIPGVLQNDLGVVFFRNIASPNYETIRFMNFVDTVGSLRPVLFEYTSDKFTNRNYDKFALGKMRVHKAINKLGGCVYENRTIMDINLANNKPLNSLCTHWNQELVEFHHDIFLRRFPQMSANIHDLSDWLHMTGKNASEYYVPFLSLFLNRAILFENFLFQRSEKEFVRNVILPALITINEVTGYKPLVVALEPTTMEGDDFWQSYPPILLEDIDSRLSSI